jgi:MFS superfamily sulfate permease-like transporter
MGIALGMVVAIFIILRNNYKVPFKMQKDNLEGKDKIKIVLSEDVTFLNKASLLKTLEQIPDDTEVEIDATNTKFIHFDAVEIIENFKVSAATRNITVEYINLYKNKQEEPIPHFKLANGNNKK